MNELFLRGSKHSFKKVNKKNKRREVFHDEINNNLIIFSPLDKEVDTNSICNSIRDKAYFYLINELNNNNGLVVHWSQIEGTTSDYTVYYSLNVDYLVSKSYKEIINVLSSQPNISAYKYTKVINSEAFKLEKETIELQC